MLSALLAGAAAGLASAPHCLGMCGPLASLASLPGAGVPGPRFGLVRHQLGRAAAYAGAGMLAGTAGAGVVRALAPSWLPAALSIALAVALSVAAARLAWPATRLVTLGRGGRVPVAARILARVPREPFVLGVATVLLPCGALYGGLLVAAGSGGAAEGAAAMLGFAVPSGVPLAAAAWLGVRPRGASLADRRLLAAALALGALVTLARPLAVPADTPPACHATP